MTERRGSLINWRAECGHWMVCYSLEPTPTQCPDCADKGREVIDRWAKDVSFAESNASNCAINDVAGWLAEDGITLPPDVVTEMQRIATTIWEAWRQIDDADDDLRRLLREKLPRAERLTIPEAS